MDQLLRQIEELRRRLSEVIQLYQGDVQVAEVYELSHQLDQLIAEYQRKRNCHATESLE